MALKNAVRYLVCLLLGGLAGYQLRSPPACAVGSTLGSENSGTNGGTLGFGSSLSGDAPAASKKKQDGAASEAKRSLGEHMKSLLDNYDSNSARKAVEALSESEIQAALALLAAMPRSSERDSLRATLYAAWAKANLKAAWKAAVAADTGRYPSFTAAVAGEIAKTQPALAMDLALSLGMGGKRTAALRDIFYEWGKVDGASAVAYFNAHPELPAGSWSVGNALYTMGEKDPQRACALALTLKDRQASDNAINNLMQSWAADDPKSALAWAQSLENATLQQSAVAQALSGWASKNPAAAMAAAQTIKDASARASATQSVWGNWFQSDPNGAMAFLSTSGDEKMLNQITWRLANGDFTPDELSSLIGRLPESKEKEDIVRNIVDTDVRKGQYARAIEQLNSLPDSSNRDQSLMNLGNQWAATDPKAAEAWLKLQPDSSDRDVAISGFATALARTNVQSAMQWAESIPDEGVKNETLKNVALRWLESDPAKADAWINKNSGWPETTIKDLYEKSKKWGPDRFTYGVNVKNRR